MALIEVLGAAVVKRRADAGDRDAQWSHGIMLLTEASEANGGASVRPFATLPQTRR